MVWNAICSSNKTALNSEKQTTETMFSACTYFDRSKVFIKSTESINIKYYLIQCRLSLYHCKTSYLDWLLSLWWILWSKCLGFFLLILCCIGAFHSCKRISFGTVWIYIFEETGERTACNFSHLKVRFPAQITYLHLCSFYSKRDRNALWPGKQLTILRNMS